MSEELQQDSAQRLEQIISTVFICRKVVKYNSVLDTMQKDKLIADIDICLCYLRAGFTSGTSKQTMPPQPRFQQVGRMMPISTLESLLNDTYTCTAFIELYSIYHAYMDKKRDNSIESFVVRFDAVVSALNKVQRLLETYQDICIKPVEDPLHCIHAFIADLYYMFMELVRTLSNVLEGNDLHINMEKITSMQQHHFMPEEGSDLEGKYNRLFTFHSLHTTST